MAACSDSKRAPLGSPTDSELAGGRYTNLYFHFTLNVPAGWSVGELKTASNRPPGAPTPTAPAAAEVRQEVTAYQLLVLSEKPLAPNTGNNPSLLVMAEQTASIPKVKDAKDYLARISQLMTDSPIAYRPVNGITDFRIGGVPAVRMDFSARLGPQKSGYQRYVVCQREQYILSFILSGTTEDDLKRLEPVMQSVKFHF